MSRNPGYRRKILFVHHGTGIGGASLELLYLLQKLDRNAFYPKVLCLHDSDAKELFTANGIEVRVLNGWRSFSHTEVYWIRWWQFGLLLQALVAWLISAFFYGRRIIREETPDLVYLNSTPLSAWAVAAKSLGVPVVCQVREPIAEGHLGIRRSLLRFILSSTVDRFVSVSRQNARALGLEKQTTVVYGFVHFEQFNQEIDPAKIPQYGNGRKLALYLGGAASIKGFKVMVDALDFLDPQILVVCGGSYPSRAGWKHFVRGIFKPSLARAYTKFYTAPNIVNIGLRQDIPRWIAACDIVISPFVVPHFARPIVEAAAMAKPVVASNVDGMEELVVDGQTGILVAAGNAKALAAAINRLSADKSLSEIMGEAGRQRAKMLFDGEKNTKATFDVVREVLASYDAHRSGTFQIGDAKQQCSTE
jgi:glycosyltransferase involved in cell wall biosynthesis